MLGNASLTNAAFTWNYTQGLEYGYVSIGANPSTTNSRTTEVTVLYANTSATSPTITQPKAETVTQGGTMSKLN